MKLRFPLLVNCSDGGGTIQINEVDEKIGYEQYKTTYHAIVLESNPYGHGRYEKGKTWSYDSYEELIEALK